MIDQSEHSLTQSEEQELFVICHRHNLDVQTRWKSMKLIAKYRQITANRNQIDNFSLLARISILVAAKSQEVKTVKGDQMRGLGLNLSALLQDGNLEIDKFQFNLKEFIHYVNQDTLKDNKDLGSNNQNLKQKQEKHITLNVEREVSDDIKKLVDKFSYCMKFYEKFFKVFEKMDFKYLDSKSQIRDKYIKDQRNFGWQTFICSRNDLQLDSTNIPHNLCLIAAVFEFIMIHSPKNLSSCWLTNKYPAYQPHSEEFNQIMLTEILDYLVIGMEGEFFRIKRDFQTFLKTNLDFKSSCLHQGKILNNVKTINDLYTVKYFNIIEDMDERFFLKDRKTIFTPSKFTPFARNSTNIHINKRVSSGNNSNGTRPIQEDKKQALNSHRVLNYEMPPPVKITSNFREIKFNNMIQSPYSMKIMTQATPLTGKMEMHNWLYSKVNPSRGLTNSSGNRKDGTCNISQGLEKYVSVLDTHSRNQIFKKTNKYVNSTRLFLFVFMFATTC